MKYNRPWKSYQEYVDAQTRKNKEKLERVWISSGEIDSIVAYATEISLDIKEGVCHGVRNGFEVEAFREKLNANIIGTEISETATRFSNVIEWDFHKIKEGWLNKFDFIYSNSMDHSYDFDFCLSQWMRTLKQSGRCFIQWSPGHTETYFKLTDADCFSVEPDELEALITRNYELEHVLKVPDREGFISRLIFVVKHGSAWDE